MPAPMSNAIAVVSGCRAGDRLGDDDLVPRVPDPRPGAGGRRDGLHRRAAGEDHRVGRDRALDGLDAGDDAVPARARARPQTGERRRPRGARRRRAASRASTPGRCVAGRPSRRSRRRTRLGSRSSAIAGIRPRTSAASTQRTSRPVAALHRDPLVRRPLVGRGHRQDHVPASDEPGVGAVRAVRSIEADRPG